MANDIIDVSGSVGGTAPVLDDAVTDIVERYSSQIIEERFGSPMLEVLPSRDERIALSAESSRLFEGMKPIRYSNAGVERAAKVVAAILGGYPQLASLDANVKQKMIASYVTKLSDLPLFAIAEAQLEIKRGSELARKHEVRPGYPPSDAQVYQIANHLCGRLREAKHAIDRVLSVNRVVPPPPKPEDRAKVKTMLEDLAYKLRAPLDAERAERKAQRQAKADAENNMWIVREYRQNGLEPHYDKDGNLITLAVLLKCGYRIADHEGERLLVPPPARTARHDEQVQSPEV